jgi:hypothetical protein
MYIVLTKFIQKEEAISANNFKMYLVNLIRGVLPSEKGVSANNAFEYP